MIEFPQVIELLSREKVEFVVIGGAAMKLHGSAYVTQDLDICYNRSAENIRRLVKAFEPFHPALRGAPEGLPFRFDEETVRRGLNFTLATDLGDIDVLGEVRPLGTFEDVLARSVRKSFMGQQCWVVSLPALIETKRFAGRTKDMIAVTELEALLELKNDEDEPASP